MAKKALGLDDSAYRDLLWTVCQVRSAAELDFAGRRRFLDHLAKCGWSEGKKAPNAGSKAVRKPLTAPQKKMWSLWQRLADAGLVDHRKMPALLAYVTRMTKVDRLEWLNGAQEDLVIESLKRWLDRRQPGRP
jgi:hypothetical protein